MLNCIALDDEPIALDIISNFCSKIPGLQLVQSFTQASVAKRYLQNFPVDLIFLDIQMPDIDGLSFYKSLQQNTMVIFTTAYSEFAVDGFNVDAVDYLLKPIEFDRFKHACQKAIDYNEFNKSPERSHQNNLYVRSDYSLMKIPFNEVLFCEKIGDYIKIHRRNNNSVTTLMSLNTLLDMLPEVEFIRVHRSFIIALSEIDFVKNKFIQIHDHKIPIGITYKSDFFDRYKLR